MTPVRFVVREKATGRVRMHGQASSSRSVIGWQTPPDWPPCEALVLPEGWQEGDPIEGGLMDRIYFIVHNRDGELQGGPYAVATQTDFANVKAGEHYAFGYRKRVISYAEAEAIAFDGPERWLIESLDDATGAGALKRKK